MIIRNDDYVEFCREQAKRGGDRHDLAFRGKNAEECTIAIQEGIATAVELGPVDDLVDIGCGDGTLLQVASRRGAKSAIGLAATLEEAALLRAAGLNVRQGLTHQLPLPDACASVVVCSCVLLVVPPEKVFASLREMHRIAKPSARIYVGEIPEKPGPTPIPQFTHECDLLLYLYRTHGWRMAIGMLRRILQCWVVRKPLILRDGAVTTFFAAPDEFISLARESGLELVRYWPHGSLNRNNYLFRK